MSFRVVASEHSHVNRWSISAVLVPRIVGEGVGAGAAAAMRSELNAGYTSAAKVAKIK